MEISTPLPLESPAQSPPPIIPSPNEHLSFPAISPESPAESSTAVTSQPRQVLKDRLYVGNLHPTVDEYALLQIFSKFGKVTKLDFLFHKAGVMKGKPRGYAFVEYGNNHEALKALTMAHEKLLRGRKLVVTFAHQAPIDQGGPSAYNTKRKNMMETGRPTTLSMLKTGMGTRNDGTRDKIAMMEAKLRQMESTNPKATANTVKGPAAPTSGSTITLHHSSLPVKPPPSLPTNNWAFPQGQSKPRPTPKIKPPLPSLPILPNSIPQTQSHPPVPDSRATATARPVKSSKLLGVKIGKPKEKPTPSEES